MTDNLGQRAARGAIWSVGGQGISTVISTITMMVLARMLLPEQFGMVAMVTAVIGVGDLIRDFGLTRATIQAESLSPAESNNLFWLNTALAASVALVIWFGAGIIAGFYDTPELEGIARVLSLNLLLSGISTQPRALLIRDLRMNSIAIVEILGAVIALFIGVAMSLNGFGYWSLVGMQIGRTLFSTSSVLVIARFMPSKPDRTAPVGHFARFGIELFGSQLITYASTNVDLMLIGRNLGSAALGYYSRANQLTLSPVTTLTAPISNVAISTLSKLRADRPRYNFALVQGQTVIMVVMMFGFSVLIVFADIVIRIALGTAWDASITPFRILSVSAAMQSAHFAAYWVYIAEGIPSRLLQLTVVTRVILIFGIVIAVPFGINTVASTIAIWSVAYWPLSLLWASKHSVIPVGELLKSGVRILTVAALMSLAGLATRQAVDPSSVFVEAFLTGSIMLIVALVSFLVIPGLRSQANQAVTLTRFLRRQ